VQKEREAEGEEFKDKEEFITSAYREKLEEFKKIDEEERRQDQIDG
jgi:coiled-coil domain-containing protein 55